MSTQTELNQNSIKYVLYFCNSPTVNNDPTVYQIDLSDVCTWGYDGSDNFQILSWLIGGYSQPSPLTLLGYTLSDVDTFYHSFYEEPIEIADSQHYKISGANLALCRADSTMIGYVVYNTTIQKQQYYDGTSWVSMW